MVYSRVTLRDAGGHIDETLTYLRTLRPNWYYHGRVGAYDVFKVYVIE